MSENGYCRKCGKKLKDPRATHCSEKCLFSSIKDSVSIYGTKIDAGENEDDPWV